MDRNFAGVPLAERHRPADALLQKLCDRAGRGLDGGTLHLAVPDGARWRLGHGEPQAEILLRDRATLLRIVRDPELNLGETYMEGAWQAGDGGLSRVLEVCVRNVLRLQASGRSLPAALLDRLGEWNDARRSARNARHHYDLEPQLYRDFLDEELHYSCAYFRDPAMTLAQAQQAKCELIARKLDLAAGARVLDIGCGFGGLALHLAQHHGARVTGITLSGEQLAIARQRAAAQGLAPRVDFELLDYRQCEGAYDAVVSVGMFEHVGRPQYQTFFRRVAALLRPGGTALIHSIGRSTPPGHTNRWIRRHIFPGGYIPAASEMTAAIERSGLVLCDLEIWRRHYAETLRHWQRRFQAVRHLWRGRLGERFCRMWEFYLQGAEASFRSGDLVVLQAQLARDAGRLPLTRDYLYR